MPGSGGTFGPSCANENPEAYRRTQTREGDASLAQLTASESAPVYSTVQAPALAVYHIPRWAEDVVGSEAVLSEECISALQRYIYESVAGFAAGMRRGRVVALADTQHVVHLVSPDTLEEVMRRWLATLPEGR